MHTERLRRKLLERDNLEKPDTEGENKIKLDIKEIRLGVAASTGFIRRRIGTIREHYSEPSICIKSGEFLDYLRKLLASQEGLCCTEL